MLRKVHPFLYTKRSVVLTHKMEMCEKDSEKRTVMKTKDSKLHQLTIKIIHVGESVVGRVEG